MTKRVLGILAILLLTATVAVAQTGPTVRERVDDAQVTAKVKAKLVAERAANLLKVNVDTRDGIVRLTGTVPTDADRAAAERLAMQTQGVKSVTNELLTETGGAASPRR